VIGIIRATTHSKAENLMKIVQKKSVKNLTSSNWPTLKLTKNDMSINTIEWIIQIIECRIFHISARNELFETEDTPT
jgi:hypothetical protein